MVDALDGRLLRPDLFHWDDQDNCQRNVHHAFYFCQNHLKQLYSCIYCSHRPQEMEAFCYLDLTEVLKDEEECLLAVVVQLQEDERW